MNCFHIFIILLLFSISNLFYANASNLPVGSDDRQVTKKSILLATHIEPPLAYFDHDRLVGSNIDVAMLLADRMNLKVRFVHCPFARCLSLLYNGQADMMVGIKKNAERQKFLSYLEHPYTTQLTPVKFYLRSNSQLEIANYNDLKNKTIGVLRGATYFDRFDNDQTLKKIEVTTHQQLVDMFLIGRFDTFLGREISMKSHVCPSIYNNEMKLASYTYKKENDSYIVLSKKSSFNKLEKSFSEHLHALIRHGDIDIVTQRYLQNN